MKLSDEDLQQILKGYSDAPMFVSTIGVSKDTIHALCREVLAARRMRDEMCEIGWNGHEHFWGTIVKAYDRARSGDES